jgi:hypothetical protein
VLIIGGFAKGTFTSDLKKLKPKRVSVGRRMMRTWTIASKALRALEAVESPAESAEVKPEAKPEGAKKKKKTARKSSAARPARKKKAA